MRQPHTIQRSSKHLAQLLATAPMHVQFRDMLLQPTLDFQTVVEKLQTMNTAPAFFILCSLDKTAILEKDYTSANVLMDDKFLACANHDKRVEDWTQEEFHE